MLVSPAGAVLAALCFFLPWGRFSCAGINRTLTGAQIGGVCWIVFAAALAIPLVVGAGLLLRRLHQARLAVGALALLGLAILLIELTQFARGHQTGFGHVHAEDVGVQLRIGGAGTVIGLLIALAGSTLPGWRRRPEERPRKTPSP
jgi:hypothetical protein